MIDRYFTHQRKIYFLDLHAIILQFYGLLYDCLTNWAIVYVDKNHINFNCFIITDLLVTLV